MRCWMVYLLALLLVSCEWETIEEEVGYKGPARVNPWLAAERFAERMGHATREEKRWRTPERNEALWFVPSVVVRTRSYVRQLEEWVINGGHVVLLMDRASSSHDDWSSRDEPLMEVETPVREWLELLGVKVSGEREREPVMKAEIGGVGYENARGFLRLLETGKSKTPVVTQRMGRGRVTIVGDASLFRNRWISDGEHAALLAAIIDGNERPGALIFQRGNAASLWEMMWKHLWAPLIAVITMLAVWLWRNLARFGPIDDVAETEVLRGYDHHLAALGNFQWKMDRAVSLLKPLREKIVENGQRYAAVTGRRDEHLFDVLAERAGISSESVRRALTIHTPVDGSDLTTITASLQKLLRAL